LALILVGIGFLIAASKLIVTGAESIAVRLGLPLFLIGSIIVAAGTSTPELVATLFARLRGHDAIGLGNILGSNVFNLSFILAVAAMIHPVPMRGSGVWLTLGWGLLVTAFCWPGRSGVLGRGRGIWLLLLYAGFVAANFVLSQGALEQPHS
jgi:cation:H+ antiporter